MSAADTESCFTQLSSAEKDFRYRRVFWQIFLPSIGNVIFVSLLIILSIPGAQGLLDDGDTAYHIQTGEIILNTFAIPRQDPYSFHQPVLPWTAHEWLAEVIMAAVMRTSGLTGIVLFFALLLSSIHWLLFDSLKRRYDDIFLCMVITILATTSSSIHWLARPHVFSLLFTVIWCHQLDRFQNGHSNALKYLPFLMIPWVNLHGGFIIGMLLIAVYLVGNACYLAWSPPSGAPYAKNVKILSLVMLGTIACSLLNPFGVDILSFPLRVANDRFIADHVIEFLSPNFHEPLPFKYMLLTLLGALALSRSPLSLIETMLVALLCYMALYSARHISLFAIVVAPILLKSVQHAMTRLPEPVLRNYRKRAENFSRIDRGLRGNLWPIGAILIVWATAAFGDLKHGFSEKKFPIAAVEFLKRHSIGGNMFNSDEFGDYLIFSAWPQYRVFMDGRSDMYGEKYGRDYLRAAHGLPGWKSVLEKYDIGWVFFDTKSPLTAALQEQQEWQAIYSDPVATIFLKKSSANSNLLEQHQPVVIAN